MQQKEMTNRWLARNAKAKGVLACGVRHPDQTTSNHAASPDFSTAALDSSWECVSSTFAFLKQNKNEVDQMCWVFDNYLLHCALRSDETCLGIVTAKNEEHDPAVVSRIISEFKSLKK